MDALLNQFIGATLVVVMADQAGLPADSQADVDSSVVAGPARVCVFFVCYTLSGLLSQNPVFCCLVCYQGCQARPAW